MVSPDKLKACSFFHDFQDSYLARLAGLCQEESFQGEEYIFREGEEAPEVVRPELDVPRHRLPVEARGPPVRC